VLSLLLFVILINDKDEVMKKIEVIKKFPDDTKMGQQMVSEQDRIKLQEAGGPGHPEQMTRGTGNAV
jgi:hypothetical protein